MSPAEYVAERLEDEPDWQETVPMSACYDDHTFVMLNGLHPSAYCDCDPTPRRDFPELPA